MDIVYIDKCWYEIQDQKEFRSEAAKVLQESQSHGVVVTRCYKTSYTQILSTLREY
jgi:hypothetical protein